MVRVSVVKVGTAAALQGVGPRPSRLQVTWRGLPSSSAFPRAVEMAVTRHTV